MFFDFKMNHSSLGLNNELTIKQLGRKTIDVRNIFEAMKMGKVKVARKLVKIKKRSAVAELKFCMDTKKAAQLKLDAEPKCALSTLHIFCKQKAKSK